MNEPIQDKAPKPLGLLPKNVQSWLIFGLAVLMVVIMWLTGGKKQAVPRAAGTFPPADAHRRGQRRQDRRSAKPHSGTAARATGRPERAGAAEPRPRSRNFRRPSSARVALRRNAPKTPSRPSARSAAIFRCLLRM